MANDDMILSFIEGDKKLELSIKGYEFDEYFKQIKGSLIHQIRIANGL